VFDWKDYGGKHYESIFTRFYQGYILPQKFKVDKRKAHLSNLIFSGQMSKEEAIEELKQPIYPEQLFRVDYELPLSLIKTFHDPFSQMFKDMFNFTNLFETEKSFINRNLDKVMKTSLGKSDKIINKKTPYIIGK
jgi:hypothetical protein